MLLRCSCDALTFLFTTICRCRCHVYVRCATVASSRYRLFRCCGAFCVRVVTNYVTFVAIAVRWYRYRSVGVRVVHCHVLLRCSLFGVVVRWVRCCCYLVTFRLRYAGCLIYRCSLPVRCCLVVDVLPLFACWCCIVVDYVPYVLLVLRVRCR